MDLNRFCILRFLLIGILLIGCADTDSKKEQQKQALLADQQDKEEQFPHLQKELKTNDSLLSQLYQKDISKDTVSTQEPKEEEISVDTIVKKQPQEEAPANKLTKAYLTKGNFMMGARGYFQKDSCRFYFNCDCCANDVIFHQDNTLYWLRYCLAGDMLLQGRYKIQNNRLQLIFAEGEYFVEESIDEETYKTIHITRKEMPSDATMEFDVEMCGKQFILKEKNDDESFWMVKNKQGNTKKMNAVKRKLLKVLNK